MGPIVVEELSYKRIFCKDCVNICKPAGAPYMPHPESICLDGGVLNYVTGEVELFLCKNKNNDGHCLSYNPKNKTEISPPKGWTR